MADARQRVQFMLIQTKRLAVRQSVLAEPHSGTFVQTDNLLDVAQERQKALCRGDRRCGAVFLPALGYRPFARQSDMPQRVVKVRYLGLHQYGHDLLEAVAA